MPISFHSKRSLLPLIFYATFALVNKHRDGSCWAFPSLFGWSSVVNQGHWGRGMHKHWDTLNAMVMDLYQVKVVRSITPFASSRARCGDWRSR